MCTDETCTILDLELPSFWLSVLATALAPTVWNIVCMCMWVIDRLGSHTRDFTQLARAEHRTQCISRLCGSPQRGVYLLSAIILLLGALRTLA